MPISVLLGSVVALAGHKSYSVQFRVEEKQVIKTNIGEIQRRGRAEEAVQVEEEEFVEGDESCLQLL
jgi:hypothetical protein